MAAALTPGIRTVRCPAVLLVQIGDRRIAKDGRSIHPCMTETTPNKQGEKPSARRARELIEKMSEQGEETKDAPELQPAKDFLNSVWQGNAISRTPSGSRRFKQSERTSGTGQPDPEADPDESDSNP